MEEIKNILSTLKKFFYFFWAFPIAVIIICEFNDGFTGSMSTNASVIYWMETVTILLTIINVPLALKLFSLVLKNKIDKVNLREALQLYKKWSLIRLLLLFVPLFSGLATYYWCLSSKGALCAAIALTASLFCVPSESKLKQDLKIENV